MTKLVINTRLFITVKSVSMLKIIEVFYLCIPHYVVECTSKMIMIMGVREVMWPKMQVGRRRRGR